MVVIGAGFTGASLRITGRNRERRGRWSLLDMDDPRQERPEECRRSRDGPLLCDGGFDGAQALDACSPGPFATGLMDRMSRQFADVYCRAAYKNADLVEQTIREEGLTATTRGKAGCASVRRMSKVN